MKLAKLQFQVKIFDLNGVSFHRSITRGQIMEIHKSNDMKIIDNMLKVANIKYLELCARGNVRRLELVIAR